MVELTKKGHVVLERNSDSALVFTGGVEPFVIAHGFDEETGTWAHGTYFSDISAAHDEMSPEILEGLTVKWTVSDIRRHVQDAAEGYGIEPWESECGKATYAAACALDQKEMRKMVIARGNEYLKELGRAAIESV